MATHRTKVHRLLFMVLFYWLFFFNPYKITHLHYSKKRAQHKVKRGNCKLSTTKINYMLWFCRKPNSKILNQESKILVVIYFLITSP